MPAVLLDANVLVALVVDDHIHHASAEKWFVEAGTGFATCPITQGSLMRLLMREGQSAESARSILREITASPRHEFWPDNTSYENMPIAGIIGHRQVTDAYLAHLARSYEARLATFDQALAKLHQDVADLVPTS
jgi:toxin-antitoxin system PIN domain toxin